MTVDESDLSQFSVELAPATHLAEPHVSGLHVAIIMDGNGRWATGRGLPRVAGHRAGVRTVRSIVEAAPKQGIETLTLYAFSTDNWQRPSDEVAALMGLLREYLHNEVSSCVEKGIRIRMIGRRDRLNPELARKIEEVEGATAGGTALNLRLAVDYSARDVILRAASSFDGSESRSREDFHRCLSAVLGDAAPDVDLLIRTGGEQRLSDFMLWESAYAELVFTRVMWPDFAPADLQAAVCEFRSRERRFGRLPKARAG